MISTIHTTAAAVKAFARKMEVVAGNVANVATDGYKKAQATMVEGPSGGVAAEVRRVSTPGFLYQEVPEDRVVERESSNVDLNAELPEMMIARRVYEANLKVLKTSDRMLGSMLDIVG